MITPNDITVQDFKDQFYRDFDYLPVWSALTTYNVGDLVFYDVNQKFYTCKVDNTLGVIPTNTTNWTLTVANKNGKDNSNGNTFLDCSRFGKHRDKHNHDSFQLWKIQSENCADAKRNRQDRRFKQGCD